MKERIYIKYDEEDDECYDILNDNKFDYENVSLIVYTYIGQRLTDGMFYSEIVTDSHIICQHLIRDDTFLWSYDIEKDGIYFDSNISTKLYNGYHILKGDKLKHFIENYESFKTYEDIKFITNKDLDIGETK